MILPYLLSYTSFPFPGHYTIVSLLLSNALLRLIYFGLRTVVVDVALQNKDAKGLIDRSLVKYIGP